MISSMSICNGVNIRERVRAVITRKIRPHLSTLPEGEEANAESSENCGSQVKPPVLPEVHGLGDQKDPI